MNDKSKKLIAIGVLLLVIIGLAAFLLFSILNMRDDENGGDEEVLQDNMEEVDFFTHFDHFDPNRIVMLVNGEYLQPTNSPRFIDGGLYLPADFLRAYVDRYIFWEPDSNRLTISTYEEISRFTVAAASFSVNGQERSLMHPLQRIGDMAYMRAEILTYRYPISFDFQEEHGILIVDFYANQQLYYVVDVLVREEAMEAADFGESLYGEEFLVPMRAGASRREPILAWLTHNEAVTFVANHGDFLQVQLANGLMGFVLEEYLHFVDYRPAVQIHESRRPVTRPSFDGAINMAWHLVTSTAATANPQNRYVMQGVNVISPTWLYFCRPSYDGTIISFGTQEYVNWAHANGMELWPMISDAFFSPETGPESFSNEAARLVLLDAQIRDFIIEQLIDMIQRYNWDGINVDYEMVLQPEGEHFIQFLRELSVPMREIGAVLSVAVYPPVPSNLWWNYPEIAHAADFITIMAYDEHWGTSPVAGSQSSFPFVHDAARVMVDELGVPGSQVVLGLPTFVRIWTEIFDLETGEWRLVVADDNAPTARTRAVGMNYGRTHMENLGATFSWDYQIRQYTASHYFTHGGNEFRNRVWLGCLRSTTEKLGLISSYQLAGVAWWQKGLEAPALWQMVNDILR